MKVLQACQLAIVLPLGVIEPSSAASSTFSALKSIDYRYFVAGGTCAAISHGITTPIDVVKTRIQSDPKRYNQGLRKAAINIVKEDGTGVLLGGLGPTVVGYGIEGAMKFGVYELMKPVFASLLGSSEGGNTAVAFLSASVVAGAVAALLLCPMESTRIRIVTDPAYAGKGLLTGLPKLISEEGLWSTFSGLWAMLAKQVPYTFGKQVSFDVFAGFLYVFFSALQENATWLSDSQTKWAVSVIAAFMASIIACIFSQPGDMILTETYRPKDPKAKVAVDGNFADVINSIYTKGGASGFFTGTGARIVHVGLIITSQLVIYDIVKQMLGLPATGSH
jgi:solute carrier family 25 phosphate transporter 3